MVRRLLTDRLRRLAAWLDGHDEGRRHRETITAVNRYIGKTERYIVALEEYIERQNTCVVCTCCLVPRDTPPHCEDTCHPDEEHEAKWEKDYLDDPVKQLRKKHGRFDTKPLIDAGAWP